jgi:DNA invertase Pin-like site-specific DNA recombinase
LRTKDTDCSITEQQLFIAEYAKKLGINIDRFEIDNSPQGATFEQREEFSTAMKALKENETSVLVYDELTLSTKVGELAEIFQCLLKRSITLHLCHKDIIVDGDFPILMMLELLVKQRKKIKEMRDTDSKLGRPEGSLSKSKFDCYQDKIINLLCKNRSVSAISQELAVSRSSLKDYINSRNLKEIALIKQGKVNSIMNPSHVVLPNRKCNLIQ